MAVIFEDIIDEIGGMGRFQILLVLTVTGSKFAVAWGMLLMTFGGKTPDWWCVNNDLNATSTDFTLDNNSYQVCTVNYTNCPHIRYDSSMKTVTEEFDLVCDRKYLISLIITIQLIGALVLTPLTGQLADFIGRKKTLFIMFFLHLVFCVASTFCVNWELYAFTLFMVGGAVGAVNVLDAPVPIEFTGRRWRSYVPGFPSWPVGAVCFALAAYLLNDWKYLSIASGVVTIPFILGMFFVPESMRWLLVHGKIDEAKRVIQRIAAINRKPCPDLRLVDELAKTVSKQKTDTSYTHLDLFRTRQMAKQTIVMGYIWFTFGMAYYTVTFGVVTLSGNFYVNLFLNGFVELPGTMMTVYFNNRIGRRCTICLSALLCSLLAAAVVPVSYIESSNGPYVISALAMSAKCLTQMTWVSSKLYTSEVNPTAVRALSLASGNMAARLGSMLAPQLIYLDQLNGSLMYLIIALTSLVSSGLIWLLPETRQIGIPDTIESIEKGHGNKPETHPMMDGEQ